ncbi:MAG: hypothetical protein EBU90_16525 [Proteobacteria bacterium]|nr:hypothetical protein [Pseudomonadota bacterium]NBP16329.1 hypothetical protein [bacterium]
MNRFITQWIRYIARFIQVQLFLSTVSLPILVAWGLPISIMTGVGNFIFNPFLALFLLCSSFIFFTELLYIPNDWLIKALEKITEFWAYCLSFGNKGWLIGFDKSSLALVIFATLCAFLTLQHKRLGQLYPSIITLSLILFSTTGYLALNRPCNFEGTITCGKKEISILSFDNKVILKDYGAFAKKLSPESWVQFNLIPEIIQKTGKTKIDCIIVENPSMLTFQALTALCQHSQVAMIELPYFDEELTKAGWRAYFNFKRQVEKEGVIIKRPLKKS